ncbi:MULTISPECIES: hypothetical protein [unclassified Mucilaginibacter]|uniref:hypothetical protein n=1 Tax=unclassified Mucilaginibacter TaxID=2617802 RepID=UPI002AC8B775|nr:MULTISPECIES: hypothetical protein [unclassified Mucilaginibacter]MEB0261683.1 hypothetical protein [Mucilaginibacter sp. 10I4]MEB0278333.1 hypothetical protein [Mucilaginibacter sp. 10B2]MEB0303302.1 hypothetical protein [Mucilaginibacter sp. 5C4]WPX23978.1 hypothetical protein RHM67_01640 [Mucilaginibacter sp. 5C4]
MEKNKTNWILFGAFALLLTLFIIWQINEQMFMINEVFALIILAVSPILKQYIFPKLQVTLLFVLLIPLFGFLQYSYSFAEANTTYTYYSGKFTGISPVVFIIMVIYIIVNISAIKNAFRFFRHGSDAEQTEKYDKMIQFYYEKFKECPDNEFIEIKSRYEDYPSEAQEAIHKISLERN